MNDKKIKNLEEKVQDHEKRILELESFLKNIKEEDKPIIEKGTDLDKLATRIGVSTNKFNEVFDIEKNTLTVIKLIGDNGKEKIQNITLLTLLGYKYFFKQDEVLSQEIRRNVAENGVPLNNFGTYLNELSPSLVRRKGELKSPKTTYRLTILGESKAKELLKNIIGN